MPVPESPDEYLQSVSLLRDSENPNIRDVFTLLYIKMEEQMRKLLVYFLRLPPHHIHYDHIAKYINDSDTDVKSGCRDISIFGDICFRTIIGDGNYDDGKKRLKEVADLRLLRNPIFHGKMMEQKHYDMLKPETLDTIESWIRLVSEKMQESIGYNGIGPMTYHPKIYATRKDYVYPKDSDHTEVRAYIESFRKKYWENKKKKSA
ncbi:hypothetical protein [Pelagicoccus sp. SDUM812002]|uniref:hypothetical protein n=1 Tax=Pelagicoccus sp. SDUM812002 TaxID=3041266 RepID=UPI00280C9ED0|nr:hypothetical protein [Pelagicoccus sp. SDUM812002]MDQ8188520.1 hypothetical protein [Pelagicoccus sp. SDUM812002]